MHSSGTRARPAPLSNARSFSSVSSEFRMLLLACPRRVRQHAMRTPMQLSRCSLTHFEDLVDERDVRLRQVAAAGRASST